MQRQFSTPRHPRGLIVQTNAQAAAERVEQAILVLERITRLWSLVIGNMAMADRCATQEAYDSVQLRIAQLGEAIGLLLPRLRGELGAAPFHLDALSLQDIHLRLVDVALRRVKVSPSWTAVTQAQEVLTMLQQDGVA